MAGAVGEGYGLVAQHGAEAGILPLVLALAHVSHKDCLCTALGCEVACVSLHLQHGSSTTSSEISFFTSSDMDKLGDYGRSWKGNASRVRRRHVWLTLTTQEIQTTLVLKLQAKSFHVRMYEVCFISHLTGPHE